MYLVNNKPDICYAVSVLSQFMSRWRQTHWIAVKHVLRIEISPRNSWIWLEICLQCRHEIAGLCQCRLGRERSGPEEHIWLLFNIGVCHGFLVEKETELCGFEYRRSRVYSVECGSHEAVWLRKLLTNLFDHEMDSTIIHCDNQSCVKLSENPVFHDKSKHIEIKYHYIRDMVQRKAVHVQYLPTHEQIADIFTKPLARTKFEYFHERLGLVENASLAEREC
jgi:hypothetical protein